MKPISTSEVGPLSFDVGGGETKKTTKAVANKIGWLHSLSDQPGARFDVTIRDALGRVKFQRRNFGSETEKYAELINLETHLGEDLHIELENVKNAKNLKVFLN